MKVNVELSADYKTPYAIIYSDQLTEEIQRMIDILSTNDIPITAQHQNKTLILQPKDIYMVRVEGGETVLYGSTEKYYSRKRLYEVGLQLGKQFMQISKTTLVNLSYLDSIEAGFKGALLLKLKNGSKDYVSRTYLSEFKRYLGL